MKSQGCCRHVQLKVGQYNCYSDLFVLPLGGCDVVLGVQWLSTVSPVLWDFKNLTMEFQVGPHQFKLTHCAPSQSSIQDISVQ